MSTAKTRSKRSKKPPRQPDALDAEIIAHLSLKPDATEREIAKAVKAAPSTVHNRMKRWQDQDWLVAARDQCKALIPRAIAQRRRALTGSDAASGQAAHDILFGLGVLSNKHEHSLDKGSGDVIGRALGLFAGLGQSAVTQLTEAIAAVVEERGTPGANPK